MVELKIHSAGRKPDPDTVGWSGNITRGEAIRYGQEGKPTAIMRQTQRSSETLVNGSF